MTCGVTAAGLADGDCAEVDGALVDGDCVTAGGGVTVWLTGGVTGRVGGITGRFAPGGAGGCTPGGWPRSGWGGVGAGARGRLHAGDLARERLVGVRRRVGTGDGRRRNRPRPGRTGRDRLRARA